jgi:RES domain-containing protein
MLAAGQLKTVLARIPLVSTHGPWSRVIGYRYMLGPPPGQTGPPQPLWGGAAKMNGARFTPTGAFDSLYLSYDPITAFTEVSALVILPNGPLPVRSAPWVVVSVEGTLVDVLDLTSPAILAALGTSEQEIAGPWLTTSQPPAQRLGKAAYQSGRITALKYPSAKNQSGINLVVFPNRLALNSGNFLEVYDPHGNLSQRLP